MLMAGCENSFSCPPSPGEQLTMSINQTYSQVTVAPGEQLTISIRQELSSYSTTASDQIPLDECDSSSLGHS